jgi:hypothetical protein
MRRIIRAVFVSVFFVAFVTGGRNSGCSCNSPPPAQNSVAAVQVPQSLTEVRRAPPPLMAPGDLPPKVEPMVLNDKVAGIVFYFETDGQHVTALRPDGSVLWHKDVAELPKQRGLMNRNKNHWTIIDWAGYPRTQSVERMRELGKQGEYIAIAFNTKEFGLLEKLTGEYIMLGSD